MSSKRLQKKIDKANELAQQYNPPMNWYYEGVTEEEVDKYIFQFESYIEERDYVSQIIPDFTKKQCLEFLKENNWYIEEKEAKKMKLSDLKHLIIMNF